MLKYRDNLDRAIDYLKQRIPFQLDWCVILGSGLGGLAEYLAEPLFRFSYATLPGFLRTTVTGHTGELAVGHIGKTGIAVMEGRFHLYEGHSAQTVVLPVRVMMGLGVRSFFITNAAGGIRKDLIPGDLMMISDHLNLMGINPLTGENLEDYGPRFPAMSNAYDAAYSEEFQLLAEKSELTLKSGIYAGLPGPSYETPAEIAMLKAIGADAVGMSTVPEVIALRHGGCRVIAVSLITNSTASPEPPTHQEVVDMANKRKKELHSLIIKLIRHDGKE
ncbi:purine-nucleoside phosphorylase [bacterium]|nr:purine-nucleoside phosphorylase [candidate division CSSED10-310 bacterium]